MKLAQLHEQRSSVELERERLAKRVEKANRDRQQRYAQLHKAKKQAAKQRAADKHRAKSERRQADQTAKIEHERRMDKFETRGTPEHRNAAGHLRTN